MPSLMCSSPSSNLPWINQLIDIVLEVSLHSGLQTSAVTGENMLE